jgi:hypothetical protein
VRGLAKPCGYRFPASSTLCFAKRCMAALPLGLAQALGPVLEQIAEMTKKIKQLRPTHQAAYGDRVPRDAAVDPGLRRWPAHGANERTRNDDSGILRDHLRATGAMEFVSAIEMGGSGSLSRMPTSQNRDMGHPILWRVQVWATRRLKIAFELAAKRRQKVTSVDKANVLEVSQLWRPVANSSAVLLWSTAFRAASTIIWIKQFYIAEFAQI